MTECCIVYFTKAGIRTVKVRNCCLSMMEITNFSTRVKFCLRPLGGDDNEVVGCSDSNISCHPVVK